MRVQICIHEHQICRVILNTFTTYLYFNIFVINAFNFNVQIMLKKHALYLLLIFFNIIFVAIAQKPIINSFSPNKGAAASMVTVNGDNFSTDPNKNIVHFGMVRGIVNSATKTQLSVQVPKGFSVAPISVTVNGLTASSAGSFVLTFSTGVDFSMNSLGPKVDLPANLIAEMVSNDLDNDGKPDVVAAGYRGFTIFPNLSSTYRTISFGQKIEFAVARDRIGQPRVVDLNGDGLAEIVVMSGQDRISVYKNISTKGTIAFEQKIDIVVGGSDLADINFADLDQDGKLDLLVADRNEKFFSVFKNISNAMHFQFAPKVEVSCYRTTYGISVSDLDGDGRPDVAVYDMYGILYLYKNLSQSSDLAFDKPIYVEGSNTSANTRLYFEDFDNDGRADLAVLNTSYSGSVSIYKNNSSVGNIVIGGRQLFTTSYYCSSITTADFDGDGKIDLAAPDTTSPSTVVLLKNISEPGKINFLAPVSYAKSGSGAGITSADYDLDGKPDMLVSSNASVINIYRNRINEFTFDTFSPKKAGAGTTITITGNALSTVTGVRFGGKPAFSFKVINDKTLEAVVGEGATGSVTVTSSEGEDVIAGFTFVNPPVITSISKKRISPGMQVVINGNNLQETVAVMFGDTPATSFNYYWGLNAIVGNGGSGKVTVYTLGGSSTFDGVAYDDKPPVIDAFATPRTAPLGAKIKVRGSGFSTDASKNVVRFGMVTAPVVNATATQLEVVVPTGATAQPITVSNLQSGLIGYSALSFHPTFNSLNKIEVNDFSEKVDFSTEKGSSQMYISDIDNDGRNDLLLLNAETKSLLIYRNTSAAGTATPTYAPKVTLSTGNAPSAIAMGDLNGDGKLDVVIANANDNNCWIYMNQSSPGNISISEKLELATAFMPIAANIRDIDLDGRPEIIIANNKSNSISVYRNTTVNDVVTPSFIKKDFNVGGAPRSIFTTMLGRDIKPSILVVYDNRVAVFSNQSEQGEVNLGQYQLNLGLQVSSLTLADLNNDGNPEIVVLDQKNNNLIICPNNNASFEQSKQQTISLINAGAQVSAADIDGDGRLDLVLSYATEGLVSIYKNTTASDLAVSLSFADKIDVKINTPSPVLNLADANGDGKFDLHLLNQVLGTFSVMTYAPAAAPMLANPPKINSFSPLSAKPGETIIINGTGFDEAVAKNAVFFGTIKAVVTAASKNQLSVTVPTAASYAKLQVLNSNTGLSCGSSAYFLPSSTSLSKLNTSDIAKPVSIGLMDKIGGLNVGDLDGNGKPDIIAIGANTNNIYVYPNASVNSYVNQPAVIIPTPALVNQVHVADINMDGKPDLLMVCKTANLLAVMINESEVGNIRSSSFRLVTFPTANTPTALSVADFDGDGRPDVMVASSVLSLFANKHLSSAGFNSASLAPRIDIGSYYGVSYMFAEDFDADGKTDILFGGSSNGFEIFKNTSQLGLPAFVRVTIGTNQYSNYSVAAIGDLNMDGKVDLLVANNGQAYGDATLSIYENISTDEIAFNLEYVPNQGIINYFNSAKTINDLQIADVDGDGKLDILAATSRNAVSILRNMQATASKTFAFAEPVDIIADKTPDALAVADLNVDGRPDFLVLNKTNNTLSVYQNWPIPAPKITAFLPLKAKMGQSLTVSGVNFGASIAENVVYFGAVRAVINSATNNQITVTVPPGASYQPIVVVNTKTAQLAYSPLPFHPIFDTKNSISASDFLVRGPNFVQSEQSIMDHNPRALAVGDLNNNGKIDYVIAHPGEKCVFLYLDETMPIKLSTGAPVASVKLADIDVDGLLDIITTNSYEGTISIFRNTGNGNFAPVINIGSSSGNEIEIADLDNDGKPEIIYTNYNVNSYHNGYGNFVFVLWNKTSQGVINNFSFENFNAFKVDSQTASFAVADIDGDGKRDIVVVNNQLHTVSILRNIITNGIVNSSAFAPKVTFDTNRFPTSLAVADFDGDGKLDIAVNSMESVAVFRNTATPGLIDEKSLAGRVTFNAFVKDRIIAADMDGDGRMDLVGASLGFKSLTFLRNTAEVGSINEGSFMPLVTLNTPEAPFYIIANDLDRDGLTDLIMLDSKSRFYTIINNRRLGNVPAITSFAPNNLRKGDAVTITGNNFNGITDVRFGGYPVESFTVVSPTAITAKIGNGFSGTVTATGPEGAGIISGFNFIDTQMGILPPVITSFSPTKGRVGEIVILSGRNFSATATQNIVNFGAIKATVVQATANSITVMVPKGAIHMPVSVTVNGLTAYTQKPFITTFDSENSDFSALSFAEKVSFDSETSGKNSLVADFDGDGKVDIAVLNLQSLSLFRNISTAAAEVNFDKAEVALASETNHFVVADFDGDGKQDILIANSNKTLSILKNTSVAGKISFSINQIPVMYNAFRLAVGDLNSDGKPDIAIATNADKLVAIYKNTTSTEIAFQFEITCVSNYEVKALVLGDIDGDGKLDVIVDSRFDAVLSIFLNKTTSKEMVFAPRFASEALTSDNIGAPFQLSMADVNGDEKLDVVASYPSAGAYMINQSTTGNPKFSVSAYSGNGINNMHALGDIDGDGYVDYIATAAYNDGIQLQRNNNKLQFYSSFSAFIRLTSAPTAPIIADFDGDGRTDFAVVEPSRNKLSVFRGIKKTEAVITSFYPIKAQYEEKVEIRGINLSKITQVFFGDQPALSFVINSSTSVTAVVGKGATGDIKLVSATETTSLGGFTYVVAPPVIFNISPRSAVAGTTVTVSGSSFFDITELTLAGVSIDNYTLVSPKEITFLITENMTSGLLNLSAKAGKTSASFTRLYSPSISSLSTTEAGFGSQVVIKGENFVNISEVKFGDHKALSFTVNSPTTITAVVGVGGSGAVTVTNANGTARINGFQFVVPPVIDSFFPKAGYVGTTITITGQHLDQTTSVSFGGIAAASFTIVSPNTITAVVAGGSSGNVALVTKRGATNAAGFVYAPLPVITSFTPDGATNGGSVTIIGTGFTDATQVSFGGVDASSFTVVSDTRINAVVGFAQSGQLKVTAPGGVALKDGFNFIPIPVLIAVGSTTIPQGGKLLLSVSPAQGYTYQWRKDGVIIPGVTLATYEATEKGYYSAAIVWGTQLITGNGITVNVHFKLPTTNFTVKTIGATCKSGSNGAIQITAAQNLNYYATISGNKTANYTFNTTLAISNLTAGTYNVCIYVVGESNYKQCYDLVVTEPKDLAVYTMVNPQKGNIILNLSGGESYYVTLNDEVFQTNESYLELPLRDGLNKLEIKTDKDCQGVFSKTLMQSTQVSVFPNPFNKTVNVLLPNDASKIATIEVLSTSGQIMLKSNYPVVDGSVTLNLEKLSAGFYLLNVTSAENKKSVIKIIKR
jgi:hypothetical protein